MFDVAKIQADLSGLVGFTQPLNPDYAVINAGNLESESGYYVNSNPFAKVEYLKDCQDYADVSDENFNKVLEDIIKNSAVNVANQVFNLSSYIDRNLIYKYAQSKNETDVLPEGFIGFRIRIDTTKSVALKITRLFCDFDGSGTLNLLLFNSAKKQVIQTKEINIDSDHVETELNWNLNDTDGLYKGEYFIGYIKDENLNINPFKRDYQSSHQMSVISHLDIAKIIVNDHSSNELFDISQVRYLDEATGLNLDITVHNDYTDLIIQNRFLFARAIQLSAIINCLQIYMASLRSNRNQRHADDLYNKILVEIEGTRASDNVISVKGLRPQLLSEISTIKDEIQRLREGYLGDGFEVLTEM